MQGREIGVGHEQVLQKRELGKIVLHSGLWTATGIRIQPNQQIVAKSLAAYWNDQKEKLDEWMQDWLAKRQPAPNAAVHPIHIPHPVHSCDTFTKIIPKTDSGHCHWPVHGEEQGTQFLHAAYLPSDISDKWEAAHDTDVGSNGGEPNGWHAPADAAPEAAEGRAAADVEHNTDVGSGGCETYGWDEGRAAAEAAMVNMKTGTRCLLGVGGGNLGRGRN